MGRPWLHIALTNTAYEMDDPNESDEESAYDDWDETTTDRDIVPLRDTSASVNKWCAAEVT